MIIIWIKFAICACIIFFTGKRVAKYGDIIAEKTGLGGLWIGVILISLATSLPELFTGVGSTLFLDAPDLTVGNLFGANTYNLVNLAILDYLHKGGPLLTSISLGALLTAGLSLIPLLIAAAGIFLSQRLPDLGFAGISIYSILLIAAYVVCAKIIFTYEKTKKMLKEIQKEEEIVFKYKETSLKTAYLRYAASAAVIAGAGIWLAYIGNELSSVMGLEQNFIGSLFLGFATTLPEITVSIAALRLGAKELAVANMLGSNLFNISIIFINDIFYRKAPIFQALSPQHIFTAFVIVFMTVIVITGMILKPKNKTKLGISTYAIGLIAVFAIGTFINFILGK